MNDCECPHCGEAISDLYEYFPIEQENPVFECPHCEKDIIGARHISYSLRALQKEPHE